MSVACTVQVDRCNYRFVVSSVVCDLTLTAGNSKNLNNVFG